MSTAAVRQSCIFTVMNLAQGASSCVAPHQSGRTAQVSPAGAPGRWSAGLVHFQQMSKEVGERGQLHTLGFLGSLLYQRPPRWLEDEMTGPILTPTPRGQRDILGRGTAKLLFYFGISVLWWITYILYPSKMSQRNAGMSGHKEIPPRFSKYAYKS